jgi:polyhydroxyalkanoate synthase
MASPILQAPAFAQALQEEMFRNLQRWNTWAEDFVAHPADPAVGTTPKDVLWKRGKVQLYRYRPQGEPLHPVPHLIVPWLGISRPYILDLLPGHSMVEFLLQHGHDVYLLDWGVIAEEDRHLGFEEAVLKILPRAIDHVLEAAGAPQLTLTGICLGGVITTSYLGLNPAAPVQNYVAVVAPIDFDQGGLFKTWLGQAQFPADLMVERFGGVPPSLMSMGFKMLRPTNDVAALSGLLFNLDKKEYIPTFKAMNRWANEFVGMPGRFYSQLSKELYCQNKLYQGTFVLGGHRVDLRHIRQPLLVVAAAKDHIVPPLAARALMDAVASTDKEYIELPGGHISVFSGRQANKILWPKIATWVAQRSARQGAPAATSSEGEGR